MNYSNIYNSLVSNKSKRAKDKSNYYESHHILPRSLGGGNEKSNLVLLTAREHYLAHRLLVKMYPDSYKMKFALLMMSQDNMINSKGSVVINCNMYDKLRKEVSEIKKSFAFISDCLEFDNNIPISVRVSSKLKARWRWKASFKKAISVLVCNGVVAYDQGLSVCYRRSRSAYNTKQGKCASSTLLQALDVLVEMGYVEDTRSDADLPVSKRKLSVYKLTELGYYQFTTLGEKI